jgi:TonB family protein
MMIRSARYLLGAALAGIMLSCAAAQECTKPLRFPEEALKRGESGISLIAFLVRADGTVVRSVVLDSSGSPDLDRETQKALAHCPFKPPSIPNGPAEFWTPVAYTWSLDDDPGMVKPKQEAAVAARTGDPGALFRLSRLLAHSAKTDADRQRALTVLRGAAAKGLAAAQYALGRRYETGDGVDKDLDQAMQWYELAAQQGDVLAVQRLRLGVLTN